MSPLTQGLNYRSACDVIINGSYNGDAGPCSTSEPRRKYMTSILSVLQCSLAVEAFARACISRVSVLYQRMSLLTRRVLDLWAIRMCFTGSGHLILCTTSERHCETKRQFRVYNSSLSGRDSTQETKEFIEKYLQNYTVYFANLLHLFQTQQFYRPSRQHPHTCTV